MNELNKIRFLLFVLLMIVPASALNVFFSSAIEDFKQKSEINIHITDGEKIYCGTLDRLTYRPDPDTTKVIVHIIDKSRFVEIIRNAVRGTILQIVQELNEWHYELVFLGIDHFDGDEYHLISAFMLEKIQPQNEDQPNFIIETIGENHFDRVYPCFVMNIGRYQENTLICGGNLRARLRDIPRGALRPVANNDKEIKLYGYHPTVGEVKWPVNVVNNTYLPAVDVMDRKYNFRIRHRRKRICLLILGGNEYWAFISSPGRVARKNEMVGILNAMRWNNEGLYIVGVFNFDWTEIDVVTQIILKHSEGWQGYDYNVFTYGYGMFNTYYRNVFEADGRDIQPEPKSNVTELIKELMGEEVKGRIINMYYSDDNRWNASEMLINLDNGRYTAEDKFRNYRFPWVNQAIAFIVHDPTEMSNATDYLMVYQSVDELKQSGIYVVLIEAINFGLDDVHIIAMWIDYHRGLYIQNGDGRVIASDQIAVLGGGIFDTIFQSESTTYNPIFDTKRNELKNIRNAFVNSGNGKRVLVSYINSNEYYKKRYSIRSSHPKFKVQRYPMNTVNGLYEPDLIPDKIMFDTTGGKRIFFIITSAHFFHQISTMKSMETIAWLKEKIEKHFLISDWSTYLVGLDNFGERDYHLFAELVKKQTKDERPLHELVWTFNYGIGDAVYQYKDTLPFCTENRIWVVSYLTSFFQVTSNFAGSSEGTSSHGH